MLNSILFSIDWVVIFERRRYISITLVHSVQTVHGVVLTLIKIFHCTEKMAPHTVVLTVEHASFSRFLRPILMRPLHTCKQFSPDFSLESYVRPIDDCDL